MHPESETPLQRRYARHVKISGKFGYRTAGHQRNLAKMDAAFAVKPSSMVLTSPSPRFFAAGECSQMC